LGGECKRKGETTERNGMVELWIGIESASVSCLSLLCLVDASAGGDVDFCPFNSMVTWPPSLSIDWSSVSLDQFAC
jgi:hypothetical protein